MDSATNFLRRFIPGPVFRFFHSPYHYLLALGAALYYRFPARKLTVIAVTGTKGKSSTVELINAILEQAGYKTMLSNTIRFKVADHSEPNLFKMSMPGRGTLQKLLRQAVSAGCTHAVIEMTSQGALLHRHRFIPLNALVFTNLSPEHIEAHGSYENYRDAKLSIARALSTSSKRPRTLIVNADDPESEHFLKYEADCKIKYSLKDAEPYEIKSHGLTFSLNGKPAISPLSGTFNLYNILAAVAAARAEKINDDVIIRALQSFSVIPGRVQKIQVGQDFDVIVDYAHTRDSLEKLYKVYPGRKLICVLGGTGGGRDTRKRPEMGRVADQYCDEIILTDEDPYDEDPATIIADVRKGIMTQTPTIIMDRKAAICEAVRRAQTGDAVLITGKGTDPYIMGPNGTKTPWSDAAVAEQAIKARL